MYACTLNVFHNAGDQYFLAVAESVNLDLFSYKVFIYQNRMLLCVTVDDADVFLHIVYPDMNCSRVLLRPTVIFEFSILDYLPIFSVINAINAQ